jgi:hypothetical protein
MLVKATDTTAVAVSPAVIDAVEAARLIVAPACTSALDGPEAITPRPNAATTASAIRLKFVFVDICFLSIVVMKTFSMAALR